LETRPIVVGVDGSEGSKRALAWAGRYADLANAPVTPLMAWEEPTSYGFPAYYDDVDFEKQALERLEAIVHEVIGDAPADLRVVHGHAATALIRASQDAHLLVVGHRGHGEFHDRLLGSIGEHCVHHAHCPVVVVSGDEELADRENV
jgi:nucleotide-binding universal stress UspA family protein